MAKRKFLDEAFLIQVLLVAMVLNGQGTESAEVPAVYIFGDSTFDVGTNNYLPESKAKANDKFYGIDFPNSQPTGRFSNGLNTADSIVKELLGLELSPPPFLYLVQSDAHNFKSQILKGVNFASGGSGLQPDTGRARFRRVIPMGEQIEQFGSVHSNISEYLNDTADATMKKALFLFSVGSNDIIDRGFALFIANDTELQQFLDTLMTAYQTHLKNLVKLGARKFGVLSVPALGCTPLARMINESEGFGCITRLNAFAEKFERALEGMLRNLSSEFTDLKYSLGKSYEITIRMIGDPSRFGMKEVKSACCGNSSSSLRAAVQCGPDTELCENRKEYLFWDQYHPTEQTSKFAACSVVNGGTESATPTNFSLLLLPSNEFYH